MSIEIIEKILKDIPAESMKETIEFNKKMLENDEFIHWYVLELHHGKNPVCRICKRPFKIVREKKKIKTSYLFRCKCVGKKFSPLKNTIVEDTKLRLTKITQVLDSPWMDASRIKKEIDIGKKPSKRIKNALEDTGIYPETNTRIIDSQKRLYEIREEWHQIYLLIDSYIFAELFKIRCEEFFKKGLKKKKVAK